MTLLGGPLELEEEDLLFVPTTHPRYMKVFPTNKPYATSPKLGQLKEA